tara:strand:+ start:178 stop:498 length:321 start_codon:yes stop_codon:yes gene_type:complete
MITHLLAFLLSLNSITLKVNGLTCSMCSLSVKKNIEKVYFVDNVDANIEEVTYNIQFKKNYYVDFYAIENAVLDAGFNVNKQSVIVDVKNTNEFWQNSNYIIWKNE